MDTDMKKVLLACVIAVASTFLSNLKAQDNEGVVFLEGKTFAEAVEIAKESGNTGFTDGYFRSIYAGDRR